MSFLFKQVDIASLAFFRIIFGVLGFADVMGSWTYKHLYKNSFDPAGFQFKYYGFEWVQPLPEPLMSLIFILILLASIGIMIGKWYRWSTLAFAIGFSYLFFLEKGYYLNHGYFTILLSFIMVLLPADREWSVAVWKNPSLRLPTIPFWCLGILPFMMGVVYFFGGIAKINSDWLLAQPLKMWLADRSDMPLLGALWAQEWVAWVMSYAGLALDLLVVFFLIFKRTRIWALGFVLFFHLTNFILFLIGIFPFLSVGLTLLYFSPDFPRRIWTKLLSFKTGLRKIDRWWKNGQPWDTFTPQLISYSRLQKRIITLSLVVFALLMCVLPLRHHYFPGPVAWTEEGHRYSWRMMLRSKRGSGHFRVYNPSTQELVRVNPSDYLTNRQRGKLLTHPDMILQFAHFLRDKYQAEWGVEEVSVKAKIRVRLNARKYQAYIDPNVDLAKEEWLYFAPTPWVLPLEERPYRWDEVFAVWKAGLFRYKWILFGLGGFILLLWSVRRYQK